MSWVFGWLIGWARNWRRMLRWCFYEWAGHQKIPLILSKPEVDAWHPNSISHTEIFATKILELITTFLCKIANWRILWKKQGDWHKSANTKRVVAKIFCKNKTKRKAWSSIIDGQYANRPIWSINFYGTD